MLKRLTRALPIIQKRVVKKLGLIFKSHKKAGFTRGKW